ncbi:STAS domain-containing protein [Nocardia sp. XZ_19_385]|uniref:STAS domain-containing protein n=1 Tax=Nocardia sp. XZ_19_385 TaxID=2769488 RepID=UPI0028169365|nr:STAS domain-containing protein [Nocardia sp. XZ_19_385]
MSADGATADDSTPRFHPSRTWAQRVDRRRRSVVVRVEGELDAAVYPEFRATLDNAIDSGAPAVVIDLRAARFVSLRAAASLGAARQRAACNGVDLRIVAGRRDIERAFELTGVRPMFGNYPSMRAALDA